MRTLWMWFTIFIIIQTKTNSKPTEHMQIIKVGDYNSKNKPKDINDIIKECPVIDERLEGDTRCDEPKNMVDIPGKNDPLKIDCICPNNTICEKLYDNEEFIFYYNCTSCYLETTLTDRAKPVEEDEEETEEKLTRCKAKGYLP